ncbi:ribonuclease D [Permianibacter sp. IMCC34836]|uniref:ribonuclease D n=1 Tax=Permianibacter fluminis TaxID=2738515 RepID=UPI001553034F|nr:ribonuclease D [Permianibacter fluminis]NQD38843.1 ribonuclease D [Permianibacter fluminis]
MTAPVAFPVVTISDDLALATACARWRTCPAIALDTEFERVRTFWPKLALIQLCDGEYVALIDPLTISNWTPFAELLRDPNVVKVMHAAGEDLEAFLGGCGEVPAPLFDTQTALALIGKGVSLGYGAAVQLYFGITLAKDMARTDWLMRPLSDDQLRYAVADVTYLLPIWQDCAQALQQRQLADWHREDSEFAARRLQQQEPAEFLYRKLKAAFVLRGQQLAVARELCAWRETEARNHNIPRGHLLKDESLLLVAQKMPRNWPALSVLETLHPRALRVHGQAILNAVERGLNCPQAQWPAPVRRLLDVPNGKAAQDAMVAAVAAFASTRGIPAELVFSRRVLENLLLAIVDGQPYPPPMWQGWRRAAVQSALASELTSFGIALPDWW